MRDSNCVFRNCPGSFCTSAVTLPVWIMTLVPAERPVAAVAQGFRSNGPQTNILTGSCLEPVWTPPPPTYIFIHLFLNHCCIEGSRKTPFHQRNGGNKWRVCFSPVPLTLIKSAVARRRAVTDKLTAWSACCGGGASCLCSPPISEKLLMDVKVQQHGKLGKWKLPLMVN